MVVATVVVPGATIPSKLAGKVDSGIAKIGAPRWLQAIDNYCVLVIIVHYNYITMQLYGKILREKIRFFEDLVQFPCLLLLLLLLLLFFGVHKDLTP